MLSVNCPRHGTTVLLSETRIRLLTASAAGLVVEWECWCGHRGREVTGRRTPMVSRHRPAV